MADREANGNAFEVKRLDGDVGGTPVAFGAGINRKRPVREPTEPAPKATQEKSRISHWNVLSSDVHRQRFQRAANQTSLSVKRADRHSQTARGRPCICGALIGECETFELPSRPEVDRADLRATTDSFHHVRAARVETKTEQTRRRLEFAEHRQSDRAYPNQPSTLRRIE